MPKKAPQRRSLLESRGELPILLEKCRADVELSLPEMKVEALKLDGSPNGSVPAAYEDGRLRFTADTASRPGGVMVYLLTRCPQRKTPGDGQTLSSSGNFFVRTVTVRPAGPGRAGFRHPVPGR